MIVISILFLVIAAVCFVAAVFSFKCKGFLFNNAYIYATKEQREKMNKKPYYKQTAIVFCFIGAFWLVKSAEMFFKKNWLFAVSSGIIIAAIIYAIISTVKINKTPL